MNIKKPVKKVLSLSFFIVSAVLGVFLITKYSKKVPPKEFILNLSTGSLEAFEYTHNKKTIPEQSVSPEIENQNQSETNKSQPQTDQTPENKILPENPTPFGR